MATSAPTRPLEVPPFQLQVVVDTVVEDFAALIPEGTDPHDPPAIVRCAQAIGKDLYVGCSNGTLLRFALQEHPHRSQPSGYKLVATQHMPENKPVDEIALVPSVSKILVLSGGRLWFLLFPGMEPVPTSLIQPIRLVLSFAVDVGPSDVHPPVVRFCIMKTTGASFYQLRERLMHDKEVPIRGVRHVKRIGQHACICDNARTYAMIDVETFQMLPAMPSSQDGQTVVQPRVAVVRENEFIVCTWLGSNAMGVFLTGSGDPVRGVLEWQQYPDAICIDFPYIAALLPNRSIEIHNLDTLQLAQVIVPPELSSVFLEPRLLAGSPGFLTPSSHRIERLSIVSVPVIPPPPRDAAALEDANGHEPKGSGLTPPPTPSKPSTDGGSPDNPQPTLNTRSGIIVIGTNGIQALVPTTLVTQAEALLRDNRMEELLAMVDQTRKRLSSNTSGVEDDTNAELRYVYQRIGYIYLEQTRFEEAGNHLFRGGLDPRLLLRHFPEFAPSPLLVPREATVPIFAGIADQASALGPVEDIIRNYSPHLKPNTRESPIGIKLKDVLMENARKMLVTFLRKSRNRRLFDAEYRKDRDVSKVVDTLLLRLWAEEGDMQELNQLVDEAFETIVFLDAEPTLQQHKRYDVLARIYERQRQTGKLLDLLASLVDTQWSSEQLPDPMSKLLHVLDGAQDRALLQKWGLWLVRCDAPRGIEVLMSARDLARRDRPMPKNISENADAALLRQIRDANPQAADQYLEYLVLDKRSTDANLHTQLAQRYATEVLGHLDEEDVRLELEAALSSYLKSQRAVPFLSFIATEMHDSVHKRARIKLALFLQGSTFYDLKALREQLEPRTDYLPVETAILESRLHQHRPALVILATNLRDTSSAEAYCLLGGIVVSPRLAHVVAERTGLQVWAALINGPKPASRRPTLVAPSENQRLTELREDADKRDLLKILLEVYASTGAEEQTARLLNSQAIHLHVVDVASTMPSTWPVAQLSSFLARSLRRQIHERHEGMIVKSIAAGQNIEANDAWYAHTLEQGALVEESNGDGSDAEESIDETKALLLDRLAEKLTSEPTEIQPDDSLA